MVADLQELVENALFCYYIHVRHIPIRDLLLQSPHFPCMDSSCAGLKFQFNVKKSEMQQEKVFSLLQDT